MSSFVKNSIAILGLIAVVYLGYYLFVLNSSSNLSNNGSLLASEADADIREFLVGLNQLEALTLDTTVLDDSRLDNLTDNSTPLPKLPVGRQNPFADVN